MIYTQKFPEKCDATGSVGDDLGYAWKELVESAKAFSERVDSVIQRLMDHDEEPWNTIGFKVRNRLKLLFEKKNEYVEATNDLKEEINRVASKIGWTPPSG